VGIERRRTEASRLLDLAYDAIFAIDAKSHVVTYWNAGAERMYGYSRQDAVGQVSSSLLKTRNPTGQDVAYEQVTHDGSWEGRLVQTRYDGSELYVDARWVADARAGIILEVNREVTEHVRLAERFELLVGSVAEYAIFLLDSDGNVVTWNAGAKRIKGYEESEIVGRNYAVFYRPEAQAEGIPALNLAIAAETGALEYEGWRVRKDGTEFWATVVITALRDPTGRLTGFAKVTRDMTAKQLERQRLAELERSKSTFLNLVAHELRSPLTVLRGYISLYRDADEPTLYALAQNSLPALEAKTVEMSRLVDQMVDVARLEEGTIDLRSEHFDMGASVERSVEAAQAFGEGSHRIVVEPIREELNVIGDRERLHTILSNLLSNAIKYSPDGGEVRITLTREKGIGRATVLDHGVGIPPEDHSRLFSPFTRVARDDLRYVAGTGMGLYLSRELARRQGGDLVLLHSSPAGSAFSVTLPLAD
jgi:PAS domain S-box-containing protein